MKKKLIAAVTSLAMMATMVPATAAAASTTLEAAPSVQNTATAKEEVDVKVFEQTVAALPTGDITKENVAKATDTYKNAATMYSNLNTADREEAKEAYATLKAVGEKLKAYYISEMEAAIKEIAQNGKVSPTETFDEIKTAEKMLTDVLEMSQTDVKTTVSNYGAYLDAQDAQKIADAIEGQSNLKKPETQTLADLKTAIKAVEDTPEWNNQAARQMASNYTIYSKAVKAVAAVEANEALLKSYTKAFTDQEKLLTANPTAENLQAAEALLEKADLDGDLQAALKSKLVDSALVSGYNTADGQLESAIATAESTVEEQKLADAFTKRVEALPKARAVTLANGAEIQQLYLIQEAAPDWYTNLVADATKTTLNGAIDAIKNVVKSYSTKLTAAVNDQDKVAAIKKEFTQTLIDAFNLPASAKITVEDKTLIDAANDVFVSYQLVGGASHQVLLDTTLSTAVGNDITSAKSALTTAESAAEDAAEKFVKEVLITLPSKKTDLNYESLLNQAKKKYEALASVYKNGGAKYTTQLTGASNKSVKEAYATEANSLRNQLRAYKKAQAENTQDAAIRELVSGIDALPAIKDLTEKDMDTVYKLRDKRDALTPANLSKFEALENAAGTAGYYSDLLEEAIKAMDKLAVKDLIQQINELKNIKSDAALADIQAAKKANTAARTAYDALTESQKDAVTNYATLQEAEKAVAAAEVQYVKTQMAEIAKMDTAKLTKDQADTILQVADLIRDLDDKQKAQITADANYTAFTAAVTAARDTIAQGTDLEKATVTPIPAQTYTGKAITPAVEVKTASGAVIPQSAYKVTYKNNIHAGTATAIIATTTAGGYTGTTTAQFTIQPASVAKASVSGIVSRYYYYNGQARTQNPVVKVNGSTLKKNTDYTLSYKKNATVGRASVTIQGKGDYKGTITKTFAVKPRKESITSLKKGTKRFTVKYKKQTGANYQIYYKSAGSKAKTVKTSAVTKTVKNLKKGKTYTVKVRAYKKIGNKTYYGKYSTVKKVTVR